MADSPTQHVVPEPRVAVFIPTYNEAETIGQVLARARRALPTATLVVLDDASPDGTGRVVDELAVADPLLEVIHRPGKAGLGAAYVCGFRWGLERGFDVLVEMDADGSHQPEDLPRLVAGTGHADLVIGSRWVPGGSVVNWPPHRQVLSRVANRYARVALGMDVADSTAGFRAYRADTVRRIDLDAVASQGYCFQIDLTQRVARAGLRVTEVPIQFVERTQGQSKMDLSIIAEAVTSVAAWGWEHRREQVAERLARRGRWHQV